MPTKYVHTNIVAKDWKQLAKFYENVFDCKPIPPERDLKGEWIDKATALTDVQINGIHLRLPGYGDEGPTLEIFSYNKMTNSEVNLSNTKGFAHVAFSVDDVKETAKFAFENGAAKLGEYTETEIPNVGTIAFWYIRDPEGNIVELQSWK